MFILFVVVFLLAAAAAYLYVQHQSFNSVIWAEVREMAGDPPQSLEAVVDAASLPAPMQRYIAYSNPDGRAPATFARMQHSGTFRRSADEAWLQIRGEQYYETSEPAFVWAATMKTGRLLWVRGRDKYIGGKGHMLIRLLSAFPIVDASGPEMDQSTLLRYISEMPWFPTAFLTVPGITYTAVDDNTVELKVVHGESTVSGRFTIDAEGAITEFHTEDRYREMDGQMLRLPWYCVYNKYEEKGGLRIPVTGKVAWQMPKGDLTYARFFIERMEYDIPAPF
ncbi:MAG: DUF6544 family protein [Bacteroidota bacterium]